MVSVLRPTSFLTNRFAYIIGSERNGFKLTLDGVDVMGERLAEEVGILLLLLNGFYTSCILQLLFTQAVYCINNCIVYIQFCF